MVGIIHYNMGNVTSVKNAFEFLNIPVTLITTPAELAKVSHVVLPGVGAFTEGMENLRQLGFIGALQETVVEKQKPFLGICLGMQLLATVGEEGGETAGLNFISGRVKRLPDLGQRIPHVGWNTVEVVRKNKLITEKIDVYFVHSFYFDVADQEAVVGECDYGIKFPAIVNKNNIYGTQFHPEKSHQAGLAILKNFVQC